MFSTTPRRALAVLCWGVLAVAAAAPSSSPPPRRQAVLAQVKVPHAYYWREMYVPQATSGPAAELASGPSSVAWSPDGTELVYAMQGSLWRQRVEPPDAPPDGEAVQLTDGPGYNHQPDWSPDGRSIVYTTYQGGALDLRVLDVPSGESRTLVANGAVNEGPRWSPDGKRVAYVSTAHEGRWHVFVVDGGGAGASTPVRITEDLRSGLPRYYYSVWDHYLSPTWSPDGRELILVSNRGHVQGTGGLWRMAAASWPATRSPRIGCLRRLASCSPW